MITKTLRPRLAVGILMLAAAMLGPVAAAGNGHGNGGGGNTKASTGAGSSTCTVSAPGVTVDNNYAWATPGSWGLPGQQLTYAVHVINYDVGCGSSSFVIAVSAPSGFSVSVPTNTISLNSSSSGYLWAYVTSPTAVADGDYPLTVTVTRSGASAPEASTTNYYKVYSSDITAPTLFWSNPSNGQVISGSSYTVNVSSSDDHAVKELDYYLDGRFVTSVACSDISYICQLSYKWSLKRALGSHTATFTSHDWLGNVGSMSVSFTVTK